MEGSAWTGVETVPGRVEPSDILRMLSWTKVMVRIVMLACLDMLHRSAAQGPASLGEVEDGVSGT